MGLISGLKNIGRSITSAVSKIPVVGGLAAGGLKFLGKHGLTIAGIGLSVAAIAGTGGMAAGPLAALATRFPMLGKLAGSAGQIGSKIAGSGVGRSPIKWRAPQSARRQCRRRRRSRAGASFRSDIPVMSCAPAAPICARCDAFFLRRFFAPVVSLCAFSSPLT